jgi:hypothetical protein
MNTAILVMSIQQLFTAALRQAAHYHSSHSLNPGGEPRLA